MELWWGCVVVVVVVVVVVGRGAVIIISLGNVHAALRVRVFSILNVSFLFIVSCNALR